mmetsp:Transcript_34365/g.83162  ORF Transcript_34365/g.83162 Transcript_34365/m.83162 type:complete len:221 (-) Transcript_34365:147-809(-)
MGIICSPIKAIVWSDNIAVVKFVSVNQSSSLWELGNQVERVFKDVFPILGLLSIALHVNLCKDAFRLKCEDSAAKLSHWMHILGEVVDHLSRVIWERGPLVQILRKLSHFRGRWNIASEEKPKKPLWKGFKPTFSLRQHFLTLGNRISPKANAFLRIQQRSFRDHALNSTHSPDGLIDGHLTEHFVSVFSPEIFNILTPWGNFLRKTFSDCCDTPGLTGY